MRKKLLFFICSTAFCTSLLGCSAPKENVSNSNAIGTEVNDSNNVGNETENVGENTETKNTVSPLPNTVDINNLDNCTVAIALEKGNAYVDDTGAMQMDVTVYTYDVYDMVDIATLKEGDTIVIRGEEVVVTSLEQDTRRLIINGGIEENGYELCNDETTVWYEYGFNDAKSYYEVGKATIRVSVDMNFYDNSDLDKGEIIYYPGDFLTDNAGIVYNFVPHNTRIVIENGMIMEMHRDYMP